MSKKLNDVLIPVHINRPANSKPSTVISLKELIKNTNFGFYNRDLACCNCVCYYDVSGTTFTAAALISVSVNGSTITFDTPEPITGGAQLTAILTSLGYGQFTFDPVTAFICIPQTLGITFGSLVTDGGSGSNEEIPKVCTSPVEGR